MHKYQLIILGDVNCRYVEDVIISFQKRMSKLSIKKEFCSILFDNSNLMENESILRNPAIALYFGKKDSANASANSIRFLLDNNIPIIPIYEQGCDFNEVTPVTLANYNGFAICGDNISLITSIILEEFRLFRKTRKIFISYRRSDSSEVAIQLFEALERCNYDVFLDTHSIRTGDDFQKELFHRMTDCDVIVMLNTKGFMDSPWCKAEKLEASYKKIGIIQLVWPDSYINRNDELYEALYLAKSNFRNDRKLKNNCVNRTIEAIESIRARSLVARQKELRDFFMYKAGLLGLNFSIQRDLKFNHISYRFDASYIIQHLQNFKLRVFIPAVCIPTSYDYHYFNELLSLDLEEVYILYENSRIRKEWINHLSWLNNNLNIKVKTLKKGEIYTWLRDSEI